MEDFTARVGNPVDVDHINGLQSLLYDNLIVSGFPVFMVAFFSQYGLEGGVYYFHTFSLEELMRCYTQVQQELLERFGDTPLRLRIMREPFLYESQWDLNSGTVRLNVDTRRNDPVALWFSSPRLTEFLRTGTGF